MMLAALAEDPAALALARQLLALAPPLAPDERPDLEALVAASVAALDAGRPALALRGPGAAAEARRLLFPGLPVTDVAAWLERCAALVDAGRLAALLGAPGARRPLVLDGDRLWHERQHALDGAWRAEAAARLARAADLPGAEAALAEVAATSALPLPEEQRRAVRAAAAAPLSVVTGPPGSGKTTIALAALRTLARLGVAPGAMALAAPTARAARRLEEAVQRGLAALGAGAAPADLALRQAAPRATTLHRLLGASRTGDRFERGPRRPLPLEGGALVVDEGSMVDLELLARLLGALPPGCRLLVLGDADQLPPVGGAGAVFPALVEALAQAGQAVRLETIHRIAEGPGADALRRLVLDVRGAPLDLEAEALLEVARAGATPRATAAEVTFAGVERLDLTSPAALQELLRRWYDAHVATAPGLDALSRPLALQGGALSPEDEERVRVLLEHQARARLLCPTNVGPHGAAALNQRLRAVARARRGLTRPGARGPVPGEPLLVLENLHDLQLLNGDVGVVLEVTGGAPAGPGAPPGRAAGDGAPLGRAVAAFREGERVRAVPLAVLRGRWAPCHATTVHKAQGAELDAVALVLDARHAGRELLYTAVSRARAGVLLATVR